MKKYKLTDTDILLLNTMRNQEASIFGSFLAHIENKEAMMAVWNVLGEKHGFRAGTASACDDGEPWILAEPHGCNGT